MMKQILFFISLAFACVVSLSSCGGSDDEIASDVDSAESDMFVGTWITINNKGTAYYMYQFWSDGCVVFDYTTDSFSTNEKKEFGSEHSSEHSSYSWTFDSSTSTLSTTIPRSPISSNVYSSFEILTYSDDFWTGKQQKGDSEYTYTFTRVTNNEYNP